MKVKAYAKINLFLGITGNRPDGYHELAMIMHETEIFDVLDVRICETGIRAHADGVEDGKNIAARAARAFFEKTGIDGGLDIRIEKNIPMEAGLGGGSADAAAVLRCANELYGRPLTESGLLNTGLALGADVPFALTGGTCAAYGVGEVLTPLENRLECTYLIIKPKAGVSTARAFALFDEYAEPAQKDISLCIKALKDGDLNAFSKSTFNALERAAKCLCPEVSSALELLRGFDGCVCAFMTGSGSACVGVFPEKRLAGLAKKAAYAAGYAAFLTK